MSHSRAQFVILKFIFSFYQIVDFDVGFFNTTCMAQEDCDVTPHFNAVCKTRNIDADGMINMFCACRDGWDYNLDMERCGKKKTHI